MKTVNEIVEHLRQAREVLGIKGSTESPQVVVGQLPKGLARSHSVEDEAKVREWWIVVVIHQGWDEFGPKLVDVNAPILEQRGRGVGNKRVVKVKDDGDDGRGGTSLRFSGDRLVSAGRGGRLRLDALASGLVDALHCGLHRLPDVQEVLRPWGNAIGHQDYS